MTTSVGSILGGAFGLVRSRPTAIAVWALVYIALAVAMGLVAQSIAARVQPSADPQANLAALRQMYATLVPLWIAMIILYTIVYAAAQRAVLRPADSAFAYLRVGMDELRLIGVTLILFLGLLVVGIVLVIVMALFIGILVVAAAPQTALPVVLPIILLGVIVWLEVRFSLVFSLTLLRREITIFESWRLTRGRFWTLFAAYLVLVLLLVLLSGAVWLVTAGPYVAEIMRNGFSPEAMQAAAQRKLDAQMAGIDMITIIGWVLGGLVSAISTALIGGAAATATRDLTGNTGGIAETFA